MFAYMGYVFLWCMCEVRGLVGPLSLFHLTQWQLPLIVSLLFELQGTRSILLKDSDGHLFSPSLLSCYLFLITEVSSLFKGEDLGNLVILSLKLKHFSKVVGYSSMEESLTSMCKVLIQLPVLRKERCNPL